MMLFAALIAGSFFVGKIAVPHLAPAPLNAVRFAVATIIIGFIAFGLRKHKVALPKAPWRFGLTGGLMAIYFVTMFIALDVTSAVSTSAVFTLMPIMTAFFGYLILKQGISTIVALSLLVAGVGALWVIFKGDLAAFLAFDIGQGELIFFVGCVCHAIYAPLLRLFNRGEPLTVLTFFTLLATTLWLAAYGAGEIIAADWSVLPPIFWWALAYLAVFPTAVTFFLLQFAALRLPSAKILAYGYLTPGLVIVYEGLAGFGWAAPIIIAGALITVLGVVVLALAPER
jgi:drug/metabolite transporter (DMT)-like permease